MKKLLRELDTRPLRDDEIGMRLIEVEGEARANFIRLAGIVVFFIIELINFYGLHFGGVELEKVASITPDFHATVTRIASLWAFTGVIVWICLQRKMYTPAFKYLTGSIDALCATVLLMFADGPQSPLVVVFLILIVVAALRGNLLFQAYATALSILGYLTVTGYEHWYRMQFQVPHYFIFIFVLTSLIMGATLYQLLRATNGIVKQSLGHRKR